MEEYFHQCVIEEGMPGAVKLVCICAFAEPHASYFMHTGRADGRDRFAFLRYHSPHRCWKSSAPLCWQDMHSGFFKSGEHCTLHEGAPKSQKASPRYIACVDLLADRDIDRKRQIHTRKGSKVKLPPCPDPQQKVPCCQVLISGGALLTLHLLPSVSSLSPF